jgi:biotin operon repressor
VERCALLQEEGADVRFAYFPCNAAVVSFEILLNDGKPVGTTLIGREGAVGGFFSHGYLPAYAQARVLLPGNFLRVALSELEKVKVESPALRRVFTGYSECFRAQLHQSAACNAAHTMEQRAAKLLRYTIDRTGDGTVPLTQEELASVLGVTRTHVTRLFQRLRALGVIETHRGGLLIRDAGRLQQLCCDCYDAVLHHFDTVLQSVYPSGQTDYPAYLAQTTHSDLTVKTRSV